MAQLSVGRLVIPSMNQVPYASPGSPMSFSLGKMPDIGPTGAAGGVYSVSIRNCGITPVFFRPRNNSAPGPGQSPYTLLQPGHIGVAYFMGSPLKDIFIDAWQFPQVRYISFADGAYTNDYPGQLEIDD